MNPKNLITLIIDASMIAYANLGGSAAQPLKDALHPALVQDAANDLTETFQLFGEAACMASLKYYATKFASDALA